MMFSRILNGLAVNFSVQRICFKKAASSDYINISTADIPLAAATCEANGSKYQCSSTAG
jgi:hypothetical protein